MWIRGTLGQLLNRSPITDPAQCSWSAPTEVDETTGFHDPLIRLKPHVTKVIGKARDGRRSNAASSVRSLHRASLGTAAFRFGLLVSLHAGFILFLKWDSVSRLLGGPLAGPLYYGPRPLLATIVLGGIFLACIGSGRRGVVWGRWSARAVLLAGISWIAVAAFAIVLAHPPLQWNLSSGMDTGALRFVVFAAIRYSVIMLALIPEFLVLFPPAFLWSCRRPLFGAGAALLVYLWLAVVVIALHRYLAPPVLAMSAVLLHSVAPQSLSYPDRLTLVNGRFTAVIGPQCLGLDAMVLFLSVWPLLWYLAARKRRLNHYRAALGLFAGLAGLALLNCMRIALIMVIGASMPAAATEFFHGAAGSVIFFIMLVALLPFLRGRPVAGSQW